MLSSCAHEFEPYDYNIVVSDEEFRRNPLASFTPPRYVPCLHCGQPMDRGRYDAVISIPALRRFW